MSTTGPHKFGSTYRHDVALADGTQLIVRTIHPDDEERLARHFSQLSIESRYMRFLAAKTSLTLKELFFFTHVDGERHVALVAVRQDDPEQIVGVARFVADPVHPEEAEPAIAIIDSMQKRGVGTLLLQRLAEAALERGVTRFSFCLLAENEPMRTLVHHLSPQAHSRRATSVLEVETPLDGA